MELPYSEPVSNTEKNRNGNNEGITVRMQISIPFCAPETAVFPSKINTIIPAAAVIPVSSCFLRKYLTSEDSMKMYSLRFIELQKGGDLHGQGAIFYGLAWC